MIKLKIDLYREKYHKLRKSAEKWLTVTIISWNNSTLLKKSAVKIDKCKIIKVDKIGNLAHCEKLHKNLWVIQGIEIETKGHWNGWFQMLEELKAK